MKPRYLPGLGINLASPRGGWRTTGFLLRIRNKTDKNVNNRTPSRSAYQWLRTLSNWKRHRNRVKKRPFRTHTVYNVALAVPQGLQQCRVVLRIVLKIGILNQHILAAGVAQPGADGRARITSDGKIRTCLFSLFDHDL